MCTHSVQSLARVPEAVVVVVTEQIAIGAEPQVEHALADLLPQAQGLDQVCVVRAVAVRELGFRRSSEEETDSVSYGLGP